MQTRICVPPSAQHLLRSEEKEGRRRREREGCRSSPEEEEGQTRDGGVDRVLCAPPRRLGLGFGSELSKE